MLGIALGVAVVLAVDLANFSARTSFLLSMEQIAGRATHRIVGEHGVPEALYTRLRIELGLTDSAPVVSGYVSIPERGLLHLIGIDPLATFHRALQGSLNELSNYSDKYGYKSESAAALDWTALLTRPQSALLPRALGATATVIAGEQQMTLRAVGWLDGPLLENVILTDLSTAQLLLNQLHRLSYIDLVLPEGADGERLAQAVRAQLPTDLRLERTATRNQATLALTEAFSLNLTAMSLLALVVGMFLIYNTMTFAVVQRRALLGRLRALGVERREILYVMLGEALMLGVIGTLLGSLIGIALGSGLVHLVTQTVHDLYYTLTVRQYIIAPESLIKVGLLGIFATLVAAWLPAQEAASSPPNAVLSRAALESHWRAAVPRLSLAGLALLGLGSLVLGVSHDLIGGFTGLFLLIVGTSLLTPGAVVILVRTVQQLPLGLLARMATRDVIRHLSRTGIAIAALMVAFAATVGVGVMVDSFRGGVAIWIRDLVNADLYVAPAALEQGDQTQTLRPAVLETLRTTSGVVGISTYRTIKLEFNQRPVLLVATELAPAAQDGYHLLEGDPATAWSAFATQDAVIISEPLAYRHHLRLGSDMVLMTKNGPHSFRVAGIFLDYGSEQGRLLMNQATYQRFWDDHTISTAAIYVSPDTDRNAIRQQLESEFIELQAVVLRSNRDIQALTLAIFDRTFTITQVLRFLAIIVAFVGIFSAFMALQLERAREWALLRATGMTSVEIGQWVSLQTGLMGLMAGLLAIPTGLMLAYVLIFVINRRAFGWSLPYHVDPMILLQTIGLATLAALLAGLYPLWRMTHTSPAEALRTE